METMTVSSGVQGFRADLLQRIAVDKRFSPELRKSLYNIVTESMQHVLTHPEIVVNLDALKAFE